MGSPPISPPNRPRVAEKPNTRLPWLIGLLLLALAIRLGAMFTQTYVIFADETFQYLEQGHRLAFGDGIVPWEYHDGIRSWLLPGAIAGLMRIGAMLGDGPLAYLWLTRGVCVLLSLSVVWVGFRMGERRAGLGPAVLAGGFCAVWFDLVWFAPAVLTEMVAAHLVLLGIGLADHEDEPPPRPGMLLAAGVCLGLAACLRYQYAPAIAAIALWQYRLSWSRWWPALTGGIGVALLAGGVLDWVTWGAPFQSVWLHFLRNTVDGVGSAMGTDPATYYLTYLNVALWPAPLLLFLAVIGATRAPVLGLAALVTILLHTMVPHKEVRFIYLALAVAPILIAFGAAALLARFNRLGPAWIALVLVVWSGLSWFGATGQALAGRWSFNRSATEAFLAASRLPDLCGLAARDMRLIDSGGYAYLHREVPLFFSDSAGAVELPNSRVTLRFTAERHRRPEPLRSIPATGGYNAMIAAAGWSEPGFTRLACFEEAGRGDKPPFCLFHAPERRCD